MTTSRPGGRRTFVASFVGGYLLKRFTTHIGKLQNHGDFGGFCVTE